MEKVFFRISDIKNDLITAIDGTPLGAPISAIDFVYNQPTLGAYWIEPANGGFPVLCTNLPVLEDQYLTITDLHGNNPYTAGAQGFVGGRPTRPIAR